MIDISDFISKVGDGAEFIISIAKSFTFVDAIDVAIVALLIYGIIKLVRETRAMQLVKGLCLFVLIFIVSNILQLQMINTILTSFFQFAIIAVMILFQPEIRKALEQMGRNNVGQSIANAVSSKEDAQGDVVAVRKAINSVVESMGELQKLRMGALVVFERKTRLGEIVETGTIINGDPTGELITNIFFNKAPLHDGGMVIRDGKVYSAGCILPLTSFNNISAALGTRHRAAIGMSENSDAIVVVVSEETAQISIAENGELTRNFNKDTLRDALTKYLINEDETKSKKKYAFSKKLPLLKRRNKDEK